MNGDAAWNNRRYEAYHRENPQVFDVLIEVPEVVEEDVCTESEQSATPEVSASVRRQSSVSLLGEK